MLSEGQMLEWLKGAEQVEPTDSPGQKKAKRDRHLELLTTMSAEHLRRAASAVPAPSSCVARETLP